MVRRKILILFGSIFVIGVLAVWWTNKDGLIRLRVTKQCEKCDLEMANLIAVDLTNANLSGSNLKGVDLSGANLSGANLTGADLTWAVRFFDASDSPPLLQT